MLTSLISTYDIAKNDVVANEFHNEFACERVPELCTHHSGIVDLLQVSTVSECV